MMLRLRSSFKVLMSSSSVSIRRDALIMASTQSVVVEILRKGTELANSEAEKDSLIR